MLLDNEPKKRDTKENTRKVHKWISKYINEGSFDLVTGYFTVGALAWFSRQLNDHMDEFRFVLGEIVHQNNGKEQALDLLNENITVNSALQLHQLAREAVSFLKQDDVFAKTLEPNFCHAKVYIYRSTNQEPQHNYYISGSSNLTEAGIGLKETNNVELNVAEFGSSAQYKEMVKWFEDLWNRPEAHKQKIVVEEDEEGNEVERKVNFKQYLIEEIEKIFEEYTPRDIYFKILYELFKDQLLTGQDDPEFTRQMGRLENTVIYQALYEFQRKGVLSLIKMLQKYNGAILADAVGLGKTWSALAILKYYQLQGRETIVLCPKKLEANWRQYLRNQESRFEKDQFDYFIRFHTDLEPDRMEKYKDRADKTFTNDRPKLFVIDESHNLRNDKGKRYQFLINEILSKNEDIKVLMLTATPINNTLLDIRNQFKLIVQGKNDGFKKTLGIRNLEALFRNAQRAFNQWSELENGQIGELIENLDRRFFSLTDNLTLARTRKMIEDRQPELVFPTKEKPRNLFVTPKEIGNYEDFDELIDHFPEKLSGYQPSMYLEWEDVEDTLRDEKQREFFLVRMMYVLLVKRLESSWKSFQSTVKNILDHHQNALDKIKAYQKMQGDLEMEDEDQYDLFEEDEDASDLLDNLTIGKKRPIKLSEIDENNMLDAYKEDLKQDIQEMEMLKVNLERFEEKVSKELSQPNNHQSIDTKLQKLIEIIKGKRASGTNNNNQKVAIFTAYKDTALYLFQQLKARGFEKLAVVSGDYAKRWDSDVESKKFDALLQHFAPYTKLYKGKEWDFSPSRSDMDPFEEYAEWCDWVKDEDPKTYKILKDPIDLLITTDVLSEGQNLQDCDMVINYDIHWNPVRVIQRMGRIDRLGSPNNTIHGVNFWPTDNINDYLNLQGRVEKRMAAMKLAGSEVHMEFSESFKQMAEDEKLERKQKDRMLEQMQTTWEDIEVSDQGLGFDDLSLERYRQDLFQELKDHEKFYQLMPRGVFSGFKKDGEHCPESGLIALLGYPSKPPKSTDFSYTYFDLIYVDKDGKSVHMNQKEILDALTVHKDKPRFVPNEIDRGDAATIESLSNTIRGWLHNQIVEEVEREDGTKQKRLGGGATDLVQKLQKGDQSAMETIKSDQSLEEKYDAGNVDLVGWFVVS
ncbi:helicase-related protein [Halalkalibaculum sp. DA3122]|uniref:helicase-related protein n=1 Tax=Halalkalibaculum sp. DA3122 TaxID=3373607 RepID=UPI003753F812